MKILIGHYYQGFYGGAEEVVGQLGRYLLDEGHDVATTIGDRPLGLYKEIRRLVGWSDVINIHNFPATLSLFPYCSKPAVWVCNEPPELFTRLWKKPAEALNRHIWRQKNRYVVVASRFDADRFKEIYKREVDYIVPYGIDYEFFSQGEDKREDREFRILQVGPVGKYKNQLASLLALKVLKSCLPHQKVKLIIAGPKVEAGTGPQYWEECKDKVKEYGLDGNVDMTGQLSREKLRELYHNCNVLLHPIKPQGGWLAPFEALAAGLPVIVSKEFAGSDMIKEKGLGIVTDNYVKGILDIYNNYDLVERQKERIKGWIRDNMTWEHYGQRMEEIFKEVV